MEKEIKKNEPYGYIPIGKHVLLSLLTFGVWQYIWMYRTTGFLNSASECPKQSPVKKMLLCMFVPCYYWYWTVMQAKRIVVLGEKRNIRLEGFVPLCVLLAVICPVAAWIVMQNKINRIVQTPEADSVDTKNREGYIPMKMQILASLLAPSVWAYVWIYFATEYLNNAPGFSKQDPLDKMLHCMVVPFYHWYWTVKQAKRIARLAETRKIKLKAFALRCLLLTFVFPPAAWILMQKAINMIASSEMEAVSVEEDQSEYVIEMLNITKEFPGIKANDDITLQLRRGEIHALLGENGAGKSTLMSVLFGMYQPEKGVIKKNGKVVKINSPNDATALNIGMVHQHFKLVDVFTVLDNIVLGAEDSLLNVMHKKKARKKVKALSEKYGLQVDLDAKVEDISVGMQQRTEILKMLYRDNEILIFDEPTAVLTPQEIDELMETMRSFAKEGKSILFITHKLNEIMAVADRCTVLRKGKYIGTVDIKDTTKQELSNMMVGRPVQLVVQKEEPKPGKVVLDVKNLTLSSKTSKKNAVSNVSFQVREGEITCIAGIDGNGQTELVYGITGLEKPSSGKITLHSIKKAGARKLASMICLWLLTFGIYPYVWIYKTTGFLSGSRGTAWKEMLLSMFVPFYTIYWFFKYGGKLDKLAESRGVKKPIGVACGVWSIFNPLVAAVIMQSRINQIDEETDVAVNITRASIYKRNMSGVSHIPEDRHKHGLVLDDTLENNIVLQKFRTKQFQRIGFIKRRAVRKYANEIIGQFDVRSGQGPVTVSRSMSGGNQQKAIVGRELDRGNPLLIAVQPTRGLDVGAIEYIHSELVAQRDAGKAVLLVSLELDEVMNLADRILVMYEGEIVGELDPKTTTVQELGLYMAGAKRQGKEG